MLHQECLSTLPQVQSLSVFDKVVLRIEVEMCAASYKFLAALSDAETGLSETEHIRWG